MYGLVRPLLFGLGPETAHRLTLTLMRVGGFEPFYTPLRARYAAPLRPVHAFGLTFKNAVGLAAGYDKDAYAVQGLSTLGFGHIEVGTVTPRPQAGNPKPRLFRLPEDEAVINRMGFPSRGAEYVQKRIGALYKPGPLARLGRLFSPGTRKKDPPIQGYRELILGVNLGRNKDTPNEEAVLDYLALLQNFAPLADYLVINVSSPNTAGLRELQGRAALEALLRELHTQRTYEQNRLDKRVPVLVKLAPDMTEQELEEAVGVILDQRMDGIIVTNTTLSRDGLSSRHRSETGGLSGRPLASRAEAVLSRVVEQVRGWVPVISAGGIMTADDAKRRIDLGARLIQVYTGLIYYGPGLVKEIVREI
jgi:dihydroorotate dehydrogenase